MSYDPTNGTSSDFGSAFPPRGTAVGFKDGTNNLAPGHVDGSGNILVNVAAGGGAGGTSSTIGAAFPATATAAGAKDNSGNMAAFNLDASGFLKVNVSAGAAGGGIAQTQVRSGTNVWTDVGYSGGDLNMPVQIAAALPAGTNVIGHVIHDSGSTTVVTGNVTVVQPTGTNLHVVVDTAPTTAVTNAGLTNLDVALSTRLKPADTLAGVTTVAAVTAITNALPAGANLLGKVGIDQTTPGTTNRVDIGNIPHVIADSGSTTAVTGNVTAVQATGSNLHVVVDTAPTTAVTNAGLTNIDVALSTRLKPADTLAGVTTVGAVTAITNALPAGSNVIGHVIVDTAPTTTVTGTVTANQGGAPWSDDVTDRAARLLGHVTVDSVPINSAQFNTSLPSTTTVGANYPLQIDNQSRLVVAVDDAPRLRRVLELILVEIQLLRKSMIPSAGALNTDMQLKRTVN